MTGDDDSRIDSILGDWRARRDEGETLSIDDLVAAHPDLADSLRARFDALAALTAAKQPSLREVAAERYADFRVLGQGGMGIVYWALDTDLNRQVAFKVVRPDAGQSGAPTPDAPLHLAPPAADTPASSAFATLKARFLQEAWVTAGLEHPGIVPVYEVGRTPEGVPYYTMRFVRGSRTLAAAVAESTGKGIDERLALLEPFLKVCDTIRYAHAHGVIHRDLKPDNVALGEFGEVVVLDWGLAKMSGKPDAFAETWQHRLQEYRDASDLRTMASALGTPGYMAPEAALGRTAEVDAKSDVYSLGAILFQILTGRLPYEFRSYGELSMKLMREDAPSAAALDASVPAELAAIAARALNRDRAQRTASVDALVADVRGWLAQQAANRELDALREQAKAAFDAASGLTGDLRLHQLDRAASACDQVIARRADDAAATALRREIDALRAKGVEERASATRRTALRRVGVAALVFLVVGGVVVAKLLDDRRREADESRTQTARALLAETQALEAKHAALVRARALGLASASAAAGATDSMRSLLLAHEAARMEMLPAVRAQLHSALAQSPERAVLRGHRGPVRDLAWTPAGDAIVSGSDDTTARVWSPAGKELAVLAGHRGPVVSVSVSLRGDLVATASQDGTAALWSIEGARRTVLTGHEGPVRSIRFSPDGAMVLTSSDDRTARVWGSDGVPRATLSGHGAQLLGAVFSPSGDAVATCSNDGTARVWGLDGRESAVLAGHTAALTTVAFSPDGARLVTASADRTARLFDRRGGTLAVLAGHAGKAYGAAFSPDGTTVLTWEEGLTSRRWDLSGRLLVAMGPEADEVHHGAFSAHGDAVVVTASWGGTARVLTLEGREIAALRVLGEYFSTSAFSPDGGTLATASDSGVIRVWTPRPAELGLFYGHTGMVTCVMFVRGGERIVTCALDETVRVWDRDGRPLHVIGGPGSETCYVSVAPDGDRMAVCAGGGLVGLWTLDGRKLTEFRAHDGSCYAIWSPRGDRIATIRHRQPARVWDLDGRRVLELSPPSDLDVMTVGFSPSGDRIVTGHRDGSARIYDLEGRELAVVKGHRLRVWSATMSPDGRYLATCAEEGTMLLHDLRAGTSTSLVGFEHSCCWARFTDDGRIVAAASFDGTVRAWHMNGREAWSMRAGAHAPTAFDLAPDGLRMLTGGGDGAVRSWLVEDQDLVALAEARRLRELTDAERHTYAELLGFGGAAERPPEAGK